MAVPSALHLALDLARNPVLAQAVRRQSLPKDILVLLRIAAEDPEAVHTAAGTSGRDAAVVRRAVILYLQQALWPPNADHYRSLGVDADAGQATLLEHFRWLMKWLHPDHQHSAEENAFAERVVVAWNALKTPERRVAYDLSMHRTAASISRSKRGRSSRRIPFIFEHRVSTAHRGWNGWRVIAVVAAAAALVAIVAIDWTRIVGQPHPANPASVEDSAPVAPSFDTSDTSTAAQD